MTRERPKTFPDSSSSVLLLFSFFLECSKFFQSVANTFEAAASCIPSAESLILCGVNGVAPSPQSKTTLSPSTRLLFVCFDCFSLALPSSFPIAFLLGSECPWTAQ